jgi:hypothetical protein
MTFVGVVIYLVIDVTILPNRVDITVRQSLLRCIDGTITSFKNTVSAIQTVLVMFRHSTLISPDVMIDLSQNDQGNEEVKNINSSSQLTNNQYQRVQNEKQDQPLLYHNLSLATSTEEGSASDKDESAIINVETSADIEEKEDDSKERENIIKDLLPSSLASIICDNSDDRSFLDREKCENSLSTAQSYLKSVMKIIKTMDSTLKLVSCRLNNILNRLNFRSHQLLID